MYILIAVDDPPHIELILRLGAQLARGILVAEPPTLLTVIKRQADLPQAHVILANAHEMLGIAEAKTVVRIGHPVDEILHEARKGSCSLIVLGEGQARSLVNRLRETSTPIRVAERAHCPVAVAKGKVRPIYRILLCDSGAPSRPILTRFTAQLAGLLGGDEEVTVLHVMSQIGAGPGVEGKELQADAEQLMEQHTLEGKLLEWDVQVLTGSRIHPRPKVRHGLVVDEIVREAYSGDYDLVVIGAHPSEGWQHLLLDDLTREIIAQLDRPVVVVR
jgi:nucleotide-binding universal stress UspA family protein